MTTDGHSDAKSVSSNDSGGLISVNSAKAETDVHLSSTVSVQSSATLTATDALTVAANGSLHPIVIASSDSGGLFAGGSGGETARTDYSTTTDIAGVLVSLNGTAKTESHTSLFGYAQGTANLGTFAGGAKTNTDMHVGEGASKEWYGPTYLLWLADATTRTTIAGHVTGRSVFVHAIVDPVKLEARSDTGSAAFGANSDATTAVVIRGLAEVVLADGAVIDGQVATQLNAEYNEWNVISHAHASCACFGGDTDANATIDAQTTAKVTGRTGSLIRTADLAVVVNQAVTGSSFTRDATRSGGFLDFGGSHPHGATALSRQTYWQVRVIMLGEPNPVLEVDCCRKHHEHHQCRGMRRPGPLLQRRPVHEHPHDGSAHRHDNHGGRHPVRPRRTGPIPHRTTWPGCVEPLVTAAPTAAWSGGAEAPSSSSRRGIPSRS